MNRRYPHHPFPRHPCPSYVIPAQAGTHRTGTRSGSISQTGFDPSVEVCTSIPPHTHTPSTPIPPNVQTPKPMHRTLPTLQSLALSLMLVGLAVQVTAGALTVADGMTTAAPSEHHDGDGHADHAATTLAVTLTEAHTASIGGDVLDALLSFFGGIVEALRTPYICDDCNLPSDGGCQCVCWSGNPRPGDCD